MRFNLYNQFKYFLIIVFLFLSGCGESTREKMGIVNTPPDEFQVYKQKDLTVPPNYELRAPGSKSDNYTRNNDENLLFDDEEKVELSITDEILLMSIGENKIENNIREIIDEDNDVKEIDKSTLEKILDFEQVFDIDADEEPDIIDPIIEKDRLEQLKSEINDIENNIEEEENKNNEDNKYESTSLHSIATENDDKKIPKGDVVENDEDKSFLDKIFGFDLFGSEENDSVNQRDSTFFNKNKKESE